MAQEKIRVTVRVLGVCSNISAAEKDRIRHDCWADRCVYDGWKVWCSNDTLLLATRMDYETYTYCDIVSIPIDSIVKKEDL